MQRVTLECNKLHMNDKQNFKLRRVAYFLPKFGNFGPQMAKITRPVSTLQLVALV